MIEKPSIPTVVAWGILLIVVGATLLMFYMWRPEHATSNYWLAMADIVAMELVAGTYAAYVFRASTGTAKSTSAVAMHLSAEFWIAVVFILGSLMSVIFAIVIGSTTNYALTFRTVLIAKWVLLLVLVFIMWRVGREGIGAKAMREDSRRGRTGMLQELSQAFTEVRDIKVGDKAKEEWRITFDEVQGTCNQLRGWLSANPTGVQANPRVETLTADLSKAIKSLQAAPEDQQRSIVGEVRQLNRDLTLAMKASSVSFSSGVN